MPSFNFSRLPLLDNIEMFSSENENEYFPFHYHDLYCVSLITSGTEVLRNTQQEFIAPAGSISITQLNEVHRNYAFSGNGYSYKTIYVNPDILRFYNNGKPVKALERVIYDEQLFGKLQHLFDAKHNSLPQWEDSLKHLAGYSTNLNDAGNTRFSFADIDAMIEEHPAGPVDTDWLCRKFCMSKFHFIREFKKNKGVTPQAYIMLYRLDKAKKMLLRNLPLADIAYQNGFTDPSHFTNSFKKYFGIPPVQFVKAPGR